MLQLSPTKLDSSSKSQHKRHEDNKNPTSQGHQTGDPHLIPETYVKSYVISTFQDIFTPNSSSQTHKTTCTVAHFHPHKTTCTEAHFHPDKSTPVRTEAHLHPDESETAYTETYLHLDKLHPTEAYLHPESLPENQSLQKP
ncbi:unnamed protein product [Microthlaspi erraticum]|uniref:Uncharacterized protein n=1 Tax=Microthlaspi erraticum TaxID=1685480 RepID=A0A6D2IFL3_9BRAS|nr:unnamed protein product [Microthlaspi erraticum]